MTDHARLQRHRRTDAGPARHLVVLAISFAAVLVLAPTAFGAGDPVRTGSFALRLSSAFKGRLAQDGVAISPRSFTIKGGSIDPTSGVGTLTLRGTLRFRHGKDAVVYRHLSATVGPGGALRARKTKLFGLSGGSVARDGFGAVVSGVDVTFPKSAAKRVRKALHLDSLRPGHAGSLRVSVQPQTVEVLSGTASITPATGPGSVSSKLAAHCVDPSTGVSVIAPGTQPGGPGSTIFFPVSFGTISPSGLDGLVQQAGGMQLANGGAGLPSGCPASNNFTLGLSDLSADLRNRNILAHVAISGSGSPIGNIDAAISFPIDIDDTWVNADPQSLALATNGSVIKLNSGAAYALNLLLPQPSPGDPTMEFQAGDLFGTAGLSVQVR